jgi:hypothetical protein
MALTLMHRKTAFEQTTYREILGQRTVDIGNVTRYIFQR